MIIESFGERDDNGSNILEQTGEKGTFVNDNGHWGDLRRSESWDDEES